MEHAEALERIEIAAAEPEGLERLMAGDTADAAAVAGHLAGCPSCTGELARVRRTAAIARSVVRSQPDPALRERTLAYVKAAGRERGVGVQTADLPARQVEPAVVLAAPGAALTDARGTASPAAASITAPPSIDAERARRRGSRLRWAAAVAAAIVITAGAGFAAVQTVRTNADAEIAARTQEVAILQVTTQATLRLQAQPDVRRIVLAAAPGRPEATGTLLFSPSSGELVAVAEGLVPEGAGQEYGCWVQVDGNRVRIGRMYWAGDLWTWAGPVDGLADIPSGATFGVSPGPVGGGTDSVPVLTGGL